MSDRSDKLAEAQLAILEQITKNATGASSYVLELAEAYAWLANPDNSHGGGPAISK